MAGPGGKQATQGGICDTCKTPDPSSLSVYVLLSWR
jgi:hypothetical protein